MFCLCVCLCTTYMHPYAPHVCIPMHHMYVCLWTTCMYACALHVYIPGFYMYICLYTTRCLVPSEVIEGLHWILSTPRKLPVLLTTKPVSKPRLSYISDGEGFRAEVCCQALWFPKKRQKGFRDQNMCIPIPPLMYTDFWSETSYTWNFDS